MYRRVGNLLIRLRFFLFPFQPRYHSSWPVAIGRVVWLRVVLARFSSSRASSLSCHRMWLARHRERRFRNSGQGIAEKTVVVVCHDSPLRPLPHTMCAVKSPMPDREPVSVCTSQPSWNFSSGKGLWLKSMASSEIFWSMWQARFAVAPKV